MINVSSFGIPQPLPNGHLQRGTNQTHHFEPPAEALQGRADSEGSRPSIPRYCRSSIEQNRYAVVISG
jgi:hypothetical protein